jgi:hypothetical protein
MSCQIGWFCFEKAEFSSEMRKIEKPSRLMVSTGSFGEAVDGFPAYLRKMEVNSTSFRDDCRHKLATLTYVDMKELAFWYSFINLMNPAIDAAVSSRKLSIDPFEFRATPQYLDEHLELLEIQMASFQGIYFLINDQRTFEKATRKQKKTLNNLVSSTAVIFTFNRLQRRSISSKSRT